MVAPSRNILHTLAPVLAVSRLFGLSYHPLKDGGRCHGKGFRPLSFVYVGHSVLVLLVNICLATHVIRSFSKVGQILTATGHRSIVNRLIMIAFWANPWVMSSEAIASSVLRKEKLRELIVKLSVMESHSTSARRHRHTRLAIALIVTIHFGTLALMTYLLKYSRDVEPLPLTDLDLMFFTYDIYVCLMSLMMAISFLLHFHLDFSYINEELRAITSSVAASHEEAAGDAEERRRRPRRLRLRAAGVSSSPRKEKLASPARRIRSLAAQHLLLCDLTLRFTSIFGLSILLMTLGTFCSSIVLSYLVIQWLMETVHVRNESLLCYGILGAIATTFVVVELTFLCSGVSENAQSTGRYLTKALLNSKYGIIRNELELFSCQMLQTKVKFEPLGLLNYDLKLLVSMSAAFVTHLSIVLQFQISALNSQVLAESQSNYTSLPHSHIFRNSTVPHTY